MAVPSDVALFLLLKSVRLHQFVVKYGVLTDLIVLLLLVSSLVVHVRLPVMRVIVIVFLHEMLVVVVLIVVILLFMAIVVLVLLTIVLLVEMCVHFTAPALCL
jgi:hypothetical protein